MKFLIVDDTPESLKPLSSALKDARHETANARDLAIAWRHIEREQTFDLIVIDIALDRFVQEFREEQRIIREGLAARGFEDLPMSGQALGLRLWDRRKELKLKYCYTTNHMYLWLPNLDRKDPEFGGGPAAEQKTVLDKSGLWQANVAEKFLDAYNEWDSRKWLS